MYYYEGNQERERDGEGLPSVAGLEVDVVTGNDREAQGPPNDFKWPFKDQGDGEDQPIGSC